MILIEETYKYLINISVIRKDTQQKSINIGFKAKNFKIRNLHKDQDMI